MRLYKRGEYWWCSFPWGGQTVRRTTRCTTKSAALLVAQRWERERADPDHAAAAAATFGRAVNAFLATTARTELADGTKSMYRQKCGVLARHFGAELPLVEVTAVRVDQFIADREKEPVAFGPDGQPTRFVSPGTIHKELVALRQVLRHARRRGEFRKAIDEVLPVGFSPQYEPRKVTLTLEQAAALWRELGPAHAAFISFILATGARRAEVYNALEGDGDAATGIVHLRGTKTGGSNRMVTVPPFARPLLAFALEAKGGKSPLLFVRWTNYLRGLKRACRRAGVPRVTLNDLRRTLSTWLIEAGVSDYVVSKVLGHATTTMVQRVYGKPRADAVGELLARQTEALPAVPVAYVCPSKPDADR